ncbi:hypothetical protein HNI00_11910 [Thermoleptolyngbya oregonensis NK1-22]|uniref:Uncharacterized protein n=1 Tax=Thermoleptolyngbya oregonensis NK1-22 TaxID=2547457 RepID=A0AA96Y9V9_9CYAN|nr:hypothetical protein [Thermoleptolyngbya oregonensis]WOB43778.1 hypothetical protein HNI00_11910 [Thermoleptolyngbya oregonensis NK1-22]
MQTQEIDIRKVLEEALEQLKGQDSYLFNVDANERSLTHKLAEYLQAYMPAGWNVDCEYNRNQGDTKKLIRKLKEIAGSPRYDDTDATTVFPDIIIHKRGNNESNLLVIEIKKSTNRDSEGIVDKEKLNAFRQPPFCYQNAVFIKIIVGDCPDYDISWVQ